MSDQLPPCRVLIADDHTLLRQGLRALVELEPDFKVVGEAADGLAAVERAVALRPDVIVMDVMMPQLDGIEATRRIKAQSPQVHVIALTANAGLNSAREMLRAGAAGYVLKASAATELIECIQEVLDGRVYLSPRVKDELIEGYVGGPGGNCGGGGGPIARVTQREREVMGLLAAGKATKEVAAALGVSVKTAETHRRAVMEKLKVNGIAELTKAALRHGLTTLDALPDGGIFSAEQRPAAGD